jgi:hypothetical protein
MPPTTMMAKTSMLQAISHNATARGERCRMNACRSVGKTAEAAFDKASESGRVRGIGARRSVSAVALAMKAGERAIIPRDCCTARSCSVGKQR